MTHSQAVDVIFRRDDLRDVKCTLERVARLSSEDPEVAMQRRRLAHVNLALDELTCLLKANHIGATS